MLLEYHDLARLRTKKIVFEESYYARDSGTLEQLKELSARRKLIEEAVNGSSNLSEAIAREMHGGTTSKILQASPSYTAHLSARWLLRLRDPKRFYCWIDLVTSTVLVDSVIVIHQQVC
eukprot:SM000120S25711  [mRNA]  locus=s120:258470:258958:- [translate_table: standard]